MAVEGLVEGHEVISVNVIAPKERRARYIIYISLIAVRSPRHLTCICGILIAQNIPISIKRMVLWLTDICRLRRALYRIGYDITIRRRFICQELMTSLL